MPPPAERVKPLCGVGVLVVDDVEDARDLMATILERAGADVTQAESVAEALETISTKSFQALVSDINMPFEDGYDLIHRVRTNDGGTWPRDLPAVAVTALSTPEDRDRVLSAGFQEHLSKPVAVDALVAAVTRVIAPAEAPPAV